MPMRGKGNSKGPLRKVGASRGSNAMKDMGRGPMAGTSMGSKMKGNMPAGGKMMRAGRRPKPKRGMGMATGRGMMGKGFEPGKTVF